MQIQTRVTAVKGKGDTLEDILMGLGSQQVSGGRRMTDRTLKPTA